ncbi:MAG: hypothetical protein QW835_05840, partial [Candidatus Hadarchaeum sp.]
MMKKFLLLVAVVSLVVWIAGPVLARDLDEPPPGGKYPVDRQLVRVFVGDDYIREVLDYWVKNYDWQEDYVTWKEIYDSPKTITGISYVGKNKITNYSWTRNTYQYESWTDVHETVEYTKYKTIYVVYVDVYDRIYWSDGTITDTFLWEEENEYPLGVKSEYNVTTNREHHKVGGLVASENITDTVVEAIPPVITYQVVDGEWAGPTEVAGTETSHEDSIRNQKSSYITEKSAPWTEVRIWSDERWNYSQPTTYWTELTYRYDTWEVWRTYYYTTYYRTPWYKTHTQIAVYSWPSGYTEEQVVGGWRDSSPYKWTASSDTTSSTSFLKQDGSKTLVDGKVAS